MARSSQPPRLAATLAVVCAASACSPAPRPAPGESTPAVPSADVAASAPLATPGDGHARPVTAEPIASTPAPVPVPAPASCPGAAPAFDTACDFAGTCTYGEDPRPRCVTWRSCREGRVIGADSPCPPLRTLGRAACPPSFPGALGPRCAREDDACSYGEVTCICSPCISDTCLENGRPVWRWVCPRLGSGPRDVCPGAPPPPGSACTVEGLRCSYGAALWSSYAGRICAGGIWREDRRPEIGP